MAKHRTFGDHDPRTWLARSGRLFQRYDAYAAAAGAFIRLLDHEPEHAPAWYGLARVVLAFSRKQKNTNLLRDGQACAKSALAIDPDYTEAMELLDQASNIEALSAPPENLAERMGWTETTFAETMVQIHLHGQRMQIVMWLGVLDEPCGEEILLNALSDDNMDVRMAALKRIGGSSNPRIITKLQEMAQTEEGRDTEPYLSMALKGYLKGETDLSHWAIPLLESLKDVKVPDARMNPFFLCPPVAAAK